MSCDIDQSQPHDFYNIDDVTGRYDLVGGLEVIEHRLLDAAKHLVARAWDLLEPAGQLALTAPNTFYPPAFLRDATQVTAFCFDELGGLLRAAGFEVTGLFRLDHDALVKNLLKRVLLHPLYISVGVDFAHQIMVVGRKGV